MATNPYTAGHWSERRVNGPGYMRFDGPIPEFLYRYRSVDIGDLDKILGEVVGETIWLGDFSTVNDDQEGAIDLYIEGTEKEIKEFWSRKLQGRRNYYDPLAYARDLDFYVRRTLAVMPGLPPEFVDLYRRILVERVVRLACFTENPLNPAMWAHYAKLKTPSGAPRDAGGVVIKYAKFADAGDSANLAPVTYSDKIPRINLLQLSEQDLVQSLYRKATEWSYEQEWRITSLLEIEDEQEIKSNFNANSRIRLEGAVQEVYFGIHCPPEVKERIVKTASEHKSNIRFKTAALNKLTREIVLRDL